MRCGSIYFAVRDFEKSLDFYEKVLDMKVSATNGTRFAMFNNEGLNTELTPIRYIEVTGGYEGME